MSFDSGAFRVRAAAVALAVPLFFALAACESGKEENQSDASPSPTEAQPVEAPAVPVEVIKKPEFPPLSDSMLGRIAEQSVVIRVDGHPDRAGILVRGDHTDSGRYEYQIICDPPSAPDTILCAAMSRGDLVVARASKLAALPGGLHVYGFSSDQSIPGFSSRSTQPTSPVYACRVEATGSLSDEERDSLTEKITSAKQRMDELRAAQHGAVKARPGERLQPSRMDLENMRRGHQEKRREEMELAWEISTLDARLSMGVNLLAGRQVAVAATKEELEELLEKESQNDASAQSGTMLASRDAGLLAIRHDKQWIAIDDLLENTTGKPSEVTLNLYGNQNEVHLSCTVDWALAFGKTGCSIIAATTYELESVEGGSLEERLANLTPETMMTNRSQSTVNKVLKWNGEPTSLWIKVFQDGQPDQPIIDEIILIDHADRFHAKWGRPPSPLIAIPQPEPDTPPNLAGEATALDARGTVLDLVAAGDGSVLMVQTDKPPFWQALDLKSGSFIESAWNAGPDTLLAAQAGKIHLIDRKTKIVETWDTAGKSRLGLQVLQLDGDIVAAAAPLLAPGAPILISTTTEGAFVDPLNFEILASGLDMSPCFSREESRNSRLPKLVPESIRMRASHDGALFAVSGSDASTQGQGSRFFRIIVDPSSTASVESVQGTLLPTRGRLMIEAFPDHGGSGIQLRTMAGSNSFPGPAGTILFENKRGQQPIAELRSSPVVPPDPRHAKGPLARDRGLYFDSSLGVLVVPDDHQIHLIPIHLPEQSPAVPEFNFAGETISIPLPKGSSHKLISNIGGETTIGDSEILWQIPADAQRSQASLKLEWIGELGSAMNASFSYSITGQTSGVSVESSDGKTSLPLRRTGIIAEVGNITGFAGSGHVMLSHSSGLHRAWSLNDCGQLFTTTERPREFFGDADQLYTLDDAGMLKAYDLLTGELVRESQIGNANERRRGITAITTGISSRSPLIAVEQDGHNPYLELIDRKTLEPTLLDFSRERLQVFFIPQFETNASGDTTWSRNAAIFRDGKNITLQTFQNFSSTGFPDESGTYVVSSDGILDIKSEPPVMTRYNQMPGIEKFSFVSFDASGRYLLLRPSDSNIENPAASVRDVRSPAVELFKIRFPSQSGTSSARLVSGTGKLICQLVSARSQFGVFEFDVPAILRELADPSPNSAPPPP